MLPVATYPDLFYTAMTNNQYIAAALERSMLLSPGTYSIKVQYCLNSGATFGDNFRIKEWQLTAEAAPVQ